MIVLPMPGAERLAGLARDLLGTAGTVDAKPRSKTKRVKTRVSGPSHRRPPR